MEKNKIIEVLKKEIETLGQFNIENNDTLIFSPGYLDSLNIINLITFIESEFEVKIDPFDVNLDSFESLNKISEYIENKLNENS